MSEFSDEQLAAFATPAWVDGVASVPLDEMAIMVAEDPSVMTTLIGALRHARAEAHGRRFDPNLVEENAWLRKVVDAVQRQTAEQIAEWLDEWDPTLAEAIALHADLYVVRDEEVSDDASITRHLTPSFYNACLLVMAAIRSGAWRRGGER